MEKYYILTFETVSNAMRTETVFKKNNIPARTVPVPGEISASCGLAIKFDENDFEKTKSELLDTKAVQYHDLYLFIKDDEGNRKAIKQDSI